MRWMIQAGPANVGDPGSRESKRLDSLTGLVDCSRVKEGREQGPQLPHFLRYPLGHSLSRTQAVTRRLSQSGKRVRIVQYPDPARWEDKGLAHHHIAGNHSAPAPGIQTPG